jgi:LacI family transcriptional regulator
MHKEKEATIYDLAKALKLSPSTVSRGLKDHPEISKSTKKKISQMAKQMEYRSNTFASNLRKQRTHTIGVIVPRLSSYFVATVLAGMEKVANEKGYNLIISQSLESEKKEIANAKTMFNNRVDGLLVSLAFDTKDVHHFTNFIQKNIPLVFFDRVYEHRQCMSVVIDNFKNGHAVTSHLIEQGCKRITHITGNLHRNVYKERFEGYKKALHDAGLVYSNELLMVTEMNEQAGIDAGNTILKMKKMPDGIFLANDVTAANCMRVLKQNGIKIPQDIAIAGFNNDPITRVVEPNLTTVNYPGYEMGIIAATSLINHLDGVSNILTTNKIVVKSELIIRESSLRK